MTEPKDALITPSPRVFISYTHDDEAHVEAVRLFSVFLAETCGIDVHMDRWDLDRRRDWSLWARGQLAAADFVLVIASPVCRVVGDGAMHNLDNRGMQSELSLIRELLHSDRDTWTAKLLPVVLPGRSTEEIPLFLQPNTADHYLVTDLTLHGADDLLRVLTGQPFDRRPTPNPTPVRLPTRSATEPRAASENTDSKGATMPDNPADRQSTTPGPGPGPERTAGPPSIANQGVMTGAIQAGGSVRISNTTKLVGYARRNPVVAVAVIGVVILLVLLGLSALSGGDDTDARGAGSSPNPTADPATGPGPESPGSGAVVDPSVIVGTWTASDGTGQKTFSANGGRCDGFYYHQGRPLDIGGPMQCTLSSKPDPQNRYALLVTQSGNRATYAVAFADDDTATVFDSAGTQLYQLTRF